MTELGDSVRVSVSVRTPVVEAFRIFTEEIDLWWRRGLRYRVGRGRSVLHLEPKLGGRLFETYDTRVRQRVFVSGTLTAWDPPHRFVLEWRAVNFAPNEKTEVEVKFEPTATGTLVTLEHRGLAALRPDHPVRHGESTTSFLRRLGLWWGDLAQALRLHASRGVPASAGEPE
ncbi:MAG: SRPBCC domain-containing protein [Polyangiaceae bacterium]